MPALKAFLTGEADIVADRWEDAAHAYNDAIGADSTFWLAYWRLWYASAWPGVEVDTNLFKAARVHRAELPDRERLLIEACTCVAESLNVAIRLAKHVTERFPNDWFGWMFYADYLVHAGPVLGYTAADARVALEHTVALAPKMANGWDHLLLMSLGKDTAATTRSLRALDSLGRIRPHPSTWASTSHSGTVSPASSRDPPDGRRIHSSTVSHGRLRPTPPRVMDGEPTDSSASASPGRSSSWTD